MKKFTRLSILLALSVALNILETSLPLFETNIPGLRVGIANIVTLFIIYQYLDKGLNDFGLLFTEIDLQKYETIPVPMKDTWGVLMRKDSPLAEKETICPEDLWDKPLIVSHQKGDDVYLNRWLQREKSELHIVATYNLIFNASLLVDEGLGYTLCYDKLVNTQGSNLCFRPHDRLICRSI